jgi:cob(I)alamin adenosyltransferase
MFDLFSVAAGAGGVGLSYFLYLAATKGLPAAVAWAKEKWNAGKADLETIQADLHELGSQVTVLEHQTVAELRTAFDSLRAEVEALKAAPPAAPETPAVAAAVAV